MQLRSGKIIGAGACAEKAEKAEKVVEEVVEEVVKVVKVEKETQVVEDVLERLRSLSEEEQEYNLVSIPSYYSAVTRIRGMKLNVVGGIQDHLVAMVEVDVENRCAKPIKVREAIEMLEKLPRELEVRILKEGIVRKCYDCIMVDRIMSAVAVW